MKFFNSFKKKRKEGDDAGVAGKKCKKNQEKGKGKKKEVSR